MHLAPPLALALEEIGARRLVLRDGSTATVRDSTPGDAEELTRFFGRLSHESRRNRFFADTLPSPALVARFADSSDPATALTLVVVRGRPDAPQIVAVASYIGSTHGAAEVAFAVDDRFQGRGISTLLLEQLAARAATHGFDRFVATTLTSNLAMREVFRDAGFNVRTTTDGSVVDVQLGLAPSVDGVAAAEARRRLATVASMQPLLAPRAIAVIGASPDETKVGSRILRALSSAGYTGALYAVHPSATRLQNVDTFRSARELPPGTDAAVIAVPAHAVPSVIDDCAAAGVKGVTVVTAGFAETGAAGRTAQEALTEQVRGYGMRMIGPNCLGLLNMAPEVRLNASFAPVVPPAGHVALSSQSGALGIALLEMAAGRHTGVSAFVSVGNKADVSSNDLLEYWEQDPASRLILLYLESFGNPRRFARIARRVGKSKPIVALKAGRTSAGSRAARSHTAAMAASDTGVDALFHQAGVVRVDTIDEMFDVAVCLDAQPLPQGRRVAIITNAGGPGILATDACEAAGLTVVSFGDETRARVQACLPQAASVANPIDMVASATRAHFRRVLEIALSAPETDAVLVIFTPVDATSVSDVLAGIKEGVTAGRAAGGRGKTVLACLMAETLRAAPLATDAEVVPTYVFPENAVRALARAVEYAEWRARPAGSFWNFEDIRPDEARAICRRAVVSRGGGWLTADETATVLGAYGVPLAPARVAQSADEAAAIASSIGFPVVAKLASTAVSHKSEVGGVRLHLENEEDVRRAFNEITAGAAGLATSSVQGVLIQSLVSGIETIVGVSHDPVFGTLVGFGSGGVDVEVLRDVRFRIAPLSDRDADELVHEIRGFPLLNGHRGRTPADLAALRELLLRVSQLAQDVAEITELDLNPVMALASGCAVVDARIHVGPLVTVRPDAMLARRN